jgi:hypothetical protein
MIAAQTAPPIMTTRRSVVDHAGPRWGPNRSDLVAAAGPSTAVTVRREPTAVSITGHSTAVSQNQLDR